ncbi:MAG TPA: hypothetical protein GYA10_00810 [Alphaproteobacteria bacterium]|nr:hypothetical protein [Alphaproteobacteria bacterium]
MAHIHVQHYSIKPRIAAANQGAEIQRTHNMLVLTAIGSMIIVVVAALFMTMF